MGFLYLKRVRAQVTIATSHRAEYRIRQPEYPLIAQSYALQLQLATQAPTLDAERFANNIHFTYRPPQCMQLPVLFCSQSEIYLHRTDAGTWRLQIISPAEGPLAPAHLPPNAICHVCPQSVGMTPLQSSYIAQ